ncbi:MAG TPA: tetratricopeptide repeat protein [Rhizomicrobium sp.]|nr:tetratricopeptide repeat protein [Rhizomicrobium sp.]
MNRFLVRTATLALGAALSAGCSTIGASNDKEAAKAAAPAAQPAPTLEANLDTEIKNAQAQRASGDLMGASKTLTQLMLVAPDDSRVVGEYGKVLAQRGKSDDAIAFLKRAVELNPRDWSLYSALGVAFDEANDHANAQAAYKQALALKPGEPAVLNNLACSKILAGDYAGAKALLEQASAAGQADPKITHNLARVADLEAAAQTAKAEAKPMTPVAAAAKPTAPSAAKPSLEAVASPKPAPVPVAALPPPAMRGVVMQKVPDDPMAGPVATHEPAKLANDAAPAKPAAKKSAKAPSLRTAAD